MPSIPLQIASAVTALLIASIAAVAGYRAWRRRRNLRLRLRQIESVAYASLRDVVVPDGNGGELHVDFLLLTARGPDSDLSGHSSPSRARSELSQRLKPATSASSAASLSDVPRPGREIERGAFWRKEKDSSRCCPAQRPSQPTTSQ